MGLHRERLRRRRGSAAPLTHNGRSSAPRPANQCERRRREPRAESEAGEGVNQETYGASSRKTTAAARLGRAAHAQRPKQRSQARQPMRAPKARAPSGKRSGRGTNSAALRGAGGCAGRLVVDELEIDHVGCVAVARAELHDARVAAGAVDEARRDVGEELVHDVLRPKRRDRLAPGGEVTAATEGDHLLGERLDGFGLRLGRLDPAVLDQRTGEVRVERLAVGGVPPALLAGSLMTTLSLFLAPQVEAVRLERLLHFLDRLLAEGRDRGELVLGLRDEVADRLDADALQAVV